MSALQYPCAPDPQAAIVHAVVRGDAATARRILQSGVVPDAHVLSPSSHLLVAAGVLPDLLSAGLNPRGLSPLANDVWVMNAVMSDPFSVTRLLRNGWQLSQDTRHLLESYGATRGAPWASVVSEIKETLGELPAGFSLTARSSREVARRVDSANSRLWRDD